MYRIKSYLVSGTVVHKKVLAVVGKQQGSCIASASLYSYGTRGRYSKIACCSKKKCHTAVCVPRVLKNYLEVKNSMPCLRSLLDNV